MQPSGQPTGHPSGQPSGQPTSSPSGQPTSTPSSQPSRQPTSLPSGQPTSQPTNPTSIPTVSPVSSLPTSAPSAPTSSPTSAPTPVVPDYTMVYIISSISIFVFLLIVIIIYVYRNELSRGWNKKVMPLEQIEQERREEMHKSIKAKMKDDEAALIGLGIGGRDHTGRRQRDPDRNHIKNKEIEVNGQELRMPTSTNMDINEESKGMEMYKILSESRHGRGKSYKDMNSITGRSARRSRSGKSGRVVHQYKHINVRNEHNQDDPIRWRNRVHPNPDIEQGTGGINNADANDDNGDDGRGVLHTMTEQHVSTSMKRVVINKKAYSSAVPSLVNASQSQQVWLQQQYQNMQEKKKEQRRRRESRRSNRVQHHDSEHEDDKDQQLAVSAVHKHPLGRDVMDAYRQRLSEKSSPTSRKLVKRSPSP